jgi:hypothetical protein
MGTLYQDIKAETNVALNQRAAGADGSLFGVPGVFGIELSCYLMLLFSTFTSFCTTKGVFGCIRANS